MAAAFTGRLRGRLRLGRHLQPQRDAATFDLVQATYREIFVPRDGRSYCYIEKHEELGDFQTRRNRCLTARQMAQRILTPGVWVGHRARADVRYLAFDIDVGSPYRPEAQLDQLEAELEGAGLPTVRIRSSHRQGVHIYAVLPFSLQREDAHWLARAVVERLGWKPGQGVLELFPSHTRYRAGNDPKTFSLCQGLRLPGQEGSALWTGSRWADEPELQWQELAAALDVSKVSGATPEFDALQQQAQALRQAARQPVRLLKAAATAQPLNAIRHKVRWTGPSQSNGHLGRLVNAAYLAGHNGSAEQLAGTTRLLALRAPGFSEWASDHTRADLTDWCRRWAECCIRKPPRASRASSDDPGRNQRLARLARVAVIDGAIRAARMVGMEALQWSERTAAAFLGISRNTFRKLKQLWAIRVTAASTAASGPSGSDPHQQGFVCCLLLPSKSWLFSRNNSSLHLVPPVASAKPVPCGVLVPTQLEPSSALCLGISPFTPAAKPADPWRRQQRTELLAWIGAHSVIE
jgi:hypothetical protein